MSNLNPCEVRLVDIMNKPARGPSKSRKNSFHTTLIPGNKKLVNRRINYNLAKNIKLTPEIISFTIPRGPIHAHERDLSTNKKSERSKCGKDKKTTNVRKHATISTQHHSCTNNWTDDTLVSEASSKELEKSAKGVKIGVKRRKTKRLSLYSQSNLTGGKRVSKRLANLKLRNKKVEKTCLKNSSSPFIYGNEKKSHMFKNSRKVQLDSHSTEDKIKNKVIKTWSIANEQSISQQTAAKPSEKINNSKNVEDLKEECTKTNTEVKSTEMTNVNHEAEINEYCNKYCSETTPTGDIVSKLNIQFEQINEIKSKVDDRSLNCNTIDSRIVADPLCDQIDSVGNLVYSEVTVVSENLQGGPCFTHFNSENDETFNEDGNVSEGGGKSRDQENKIEDPREVISKSPECNDCISKLPKSEIYIITDSGENSLSINEHKSITESVKSNDCNELDGFVSELCVLPEAKE